MAGLGFDEEEELDKDMSEEEKLLMEEAEHLREDLDDLRKEMQDTDFYTLTESLPEVNRIKFKPRRHFRGHLAKITDLHWASDSLHVLTCSQDSKMFLWDTITSNKVQMITLKSPWVMGCCISPSSRLTASGGLDNLVTVHNLDSASGPEGSFDEMTGHNGYLSGCRYIDDNSLVTGSGDRTCALWDVERLTQTETFKGHQNDVNGIALMSGGESNFISVSSDKSCRLWDIRDVTCKQIFQGHAQEVNSIDFFPNNEYAFATSSDDGSCRLWDIRADQPIALYTDEYIQCGCTSVAISKSGRLLIAGYDDYNCHVWDLLREERVGIMPAHDDRVSCVGVSKDGVAVATGAWDNTCILWTTN